MIRLFQRRRLLCAVLCAAAAVPVCAQAGSTSSSTLLVSMTVQSSISLQFVNSGSGVGYCPVTGAGTNSASLNLGIASSAGDNNDSQNGGCVSWTPSPGGYTITNYVSINVTEANTSSNSYAIKAALASAPPTGVTWTFHTMTGNLSTTPQSVNSNVSYGSDYQMQLIVTVAKTVAAGNIGNTIDFTATAN